MKNPDSSDTTHPRSDDVRGRERHEGGYGESGGFGDRGYDDRGDFGDQGGFGDQPGGPAAHREAGADGGTPEHDAPPED